MRAAALLLFALITQHLAAQDAVLHLQALNNKGQVAQLYRYDDLFTLRTVRLTEALIGDEGSATLTAPVEGTTKLQVRIGDVSGDLFARPGSIYQVTFPMLAPGVARSLNGTAKVALVFTDLDRTDVNAITTDLNDRIDAFISQDLATDEIGGMQAVDVKRKPGVQQTDTARRPSTLFITPTLSRLRVDSFETKLHHFYRELNDPWFARYMDNSIAGLRHGPRVNDKDLHDRYLKKKPVVYDDPEYVRILRSIHSEQLHLAERFHGDALQRAFDLTDADSLNAVLSLNDMLKEDPQLRELVMIDLIYQQYHGRLVPRAAAEKILGQVAERSAYPGTRRVAANMLWDLTAMRVGSRLPALRLEDLAGKEPDMNELLSGPVCLAVTASWCTYCELEMVGLEQLSVEYKDVLPIVIICLDPDLDAVKKYRKTHPDLNAMWLHAIGEQRLREDLRMRSLPAFFLLNDGVLARSPAPLPSSGLGALFHQVRVNAEKGERIKVWDD